MVFLYINLFVPLFRLSPSPSLYLNICFTDVTLVVAKYLDDRFLINEWQKNAQLA